MNVYTIIGFTGHWPAGTAAVVVAQTAAMAARALEEALRQQGLPQMIDPAKMERLSTYVPTIRILNDGNY